MEQWIELARAATPDGDELILRQRGEEFDIRFNGWEAMASRASRSEEALARLVFADLRDQERILIGGLGMGYMLRAALDALGANARVVVAELVPEVVDWARGPLAHLAGRPLDDKRVEIRLGSVVDILWASEGAFDAILLDIDNGPEALLRAANGYLYSRRGLLSATRSLKPEGRLGFWSADRSTTFEQSLDETGLIWRRVDIAVRGESGGPEHSLYLARLPRTLAP